MRLAASNIAWTAEQDANMYAFLRNNGYIGLEIAPSRLFGEDPYEKLMQATEYARMLLETYGLRIVSMQSIWYGRPENLFSGETERRFLIDYTKRAIDWAHAIGCENLVFGCPRNRNRPEHADVAIADAFFSEIGEYAAHSETIIALEPNPCIYHTNFINTHSTAFDYIGKIGSPGLQVNLDTGALLYNHTPLELIHTRLDRVHHVHISEPNLVPLQSRDLHGKLLRLLCKSGYCGYISLEMGCYNPPILKKALAYLRETAALADGEIS